jgi:hypothetical protein
MQGIWRVNADILPANAAKFRWQMFPGFGVSRFSRVAKADAQLMKL